MRPLLVARVHARGESLLPGDAGKEPAELLSLGRGEGSADVVLVRGADGPELRLHELPARGGQVEGVVPAVVRVAPSLDEAATFEVVHEQHEPAGRGPQLAGEFLLALPRLPGDQPQEARLGRREVEVGDPLGERRRGVYIGELLSFVYQLAIPTGHDDDDQRHRRDQDRTAGRPAAAGARDRLRRAGAGRHLRRGDGPAGPCARTALAGVGEELLFRGVVYGWLRRRLTATSAIAVTTVLFALEHAYYPILLPLVLACGLATGWVRHRTGTIGATIPMHIAVDLGLFFAAVALA
jgi:hypothetical protein